MSFQGKSLQLVPDPVARMLWLGQRALVSQGVVDFQIANHWVVSIETATFGGSL